MVTFSLCMIVKNEAAILRRCLASIADLMDEIIIVDTGSTDHTKKIAAEFTDKIYDYVWKNDFADARNFAFSQAKMEYIYSADADEVVDEENHERLWQLKQALLPEIEIVQMYYVTPPQYNTTSNFLREYRPKLYKRLRTFTWVDMVHETVRLDPVVYDSEVEILHLPQSLHSQRDFALFRLAFAREGQLSKKLHSMYAKELFISGKAADFADAIEVFSATLQRAESPVEMVEEAICVLCHAHRMEGRVDAFFSLAWKLMPGALCAEICYEVGSYFLEKADYPEAIQWFEAACQAQAVIDVRRCGELPLAALGQCWREVAGASQGNEEFLRTCLEKADIYEKEAQTWKKPADV